MDPNETLELMIEAACEGDGDTLREACADLRTWLVRGGFPPGPQAAYRAAIRLGFNPLPKED